jgi:hypothetical protein
MGQSQNSEKEEIDGEEEVDIFFGEHLTNEIQVIQLNLHIIEYTNPTTHSTFRQRHRLIATIVFNLTHLKEDVQSEQSTTRDERKHRCVLA